VLDATTYLAGLASPPSVMTTSYGGNEDSFSRSDAQKICAGYMALGARGISVLYSSGDGGVRGGKDEASQCTNNTFIPVFPASCPYGETLDFCQEWNTLLISPVTAVGSTIGISPERATNFTSGGFSNYFSRPWYQDHAVGSFLKTVPASFPGVFNRSGRGFPDVATQGWHFEVYVGGKLRTVGGTSASTPTFASIIAIVNDRLGALGRPSLGYLNRSLSSRCPMGTCPDGFTAFLYLSAAPAGVFNDVISGKNPGLTCNDTAVAFSAQAGWDPATGMHAWMYSELILTRTDAGFGTPNYPKLLAAAGIKSSF
jgi:tripeptidyl-peptidase-1